MTKKWNDPQLDRAQFAADAFYKRFEEIAERIAFLKEASKAGSLTDAQTAASQRNLAFSERE